MKRRDPARDKHLGRDVPIKVLPEAFAHDAERMARSHREDTYDICTLDTEGG